MTPPIKRPTHWPHPRLLLGLALQRHGALPLVACTLLLLGLLAWGWLLPRHAALARTAQRWATVAAPAERNSDGPPPALTELHQALIDPKAVNDSVRALLAQAQTQGVAIGKVEYRWGAARAGTAPARVQLGLPLRGEYPAIKQFLATVLLGLPGASIDQIALKRVSGHGPSPGNSGEGGAATAGLDGMVWLSLWQRTLLEPSNAAGTDANGREVSTEGDGP